MNVCNKLECRSLQGPSSQMFVSEAEEYLSEVVHTRVGTWLYPQTLNYAGKAYQGHTCSKYSSLVRKVVNYGQKSFKTLVPDEAFRRRFSHPFNLKLKSL